MDVGSIDCFFLVIFGFSYIKMIICDFIEKGLFKKWIFVFCIFFEFLVEFSLRVLK